MSREIMKRIVFGVAYGCIISTFISMIGVAMSGDAWFTSSPRGYIVSSICAILVGIGFSVPSLVYQSEKLGLLYKIGIHMGIGMVIYFAVALYAGWIPLNYGVDMIVLSVGIALITSFCIWSLFYLYYKRQANIMNREITKMQN